MGLFKKSKSDIENLIYAIENKNIDKVKSILENSNKIQKVLNLNEKNKNKTSPFLKSIIKMDNVFIFEKNLNIYFEIFQLLIEYANEHQIILELNDRNKRGDYPLLRAISYNYVKSTTIVKLLIEYANQHQITLVLNEKNGYGNYPLLEAVDNDNIEVVKLLIEYANQHHIILEVNEKDGIWGNYPLTKAIHNKNTEMIKLLIDYANQHQIILNYNKKKIGKKPEIIELIQNYERENEMRYERKVGRERSIFNNNNNNNDNDNNYQEKEMKTKQNKNSKDELPKTPTLVIATNDFNGGEKYDYLDIKKDEFLMVTNWNCTEKGWVYGYRKNNKEEKGYFPEVFIKIYKEENREKRVMRNEVTPEYKIEFEDKIYQLRSLFEMNNIDYSDTSIKVNRNNLFSDAFISVMSKSPTELKRNLKVTYIEEEGIDAGGLLRDFFYQISKEIGNPNYSLFKYSHDNSYALEINPLSSIVESNYLQYYRFVGRIIGLAIFNKQYLSLSFTLPFYKKLLNKPLEFSDLEYIDPQLYKNLKQLRDNHGAEDLYLTFSMDTVDCFGNHKTIELKPNGANIDVTDSNKNEYIDLVIENKLNNADVKDQLEALKQGFYEIIPQNIDIIMDEIDLKYLISGIYIIDVDDWENNTDYEGYDKNDITIINFWKCVRNFSNESRTKLLIFATGNSQVPVTGFKDLQGNGGIQPFKLKKKGTEKDLPISHTCFNYIDLPPYTSLTIMRQKLLLAISEGVGGFSIE